MKEWLIRDMTSSSKVMWSQAESMRSISKRSKSLEFHLIARRRTLNPMRNMWISPCCSRKKTSSIMLSKLIKRLYQVLGSFPEGQLILTSRMWLHRELSKSLMRKILESFFSDLHLRERTTSLLPGNSTMATLFTSILLSLRKQQVLLSVQSQPQEKRSLRTCKKSLIDTSSHATD